MSDDTSKIGSSDWFSKTAALQIAESKTLACDAMRAILGLWDRDQKLFWRSTEHRLRERGSDDKTKFFPTAALRSIDALLSIATNYPDWLDEGQKNLILEECLPRAVAIRDEELKSSLAAETSDCHNHPFTLSLYVRVLSQICRLEKIPSEYVETSRMRLAGAVKLLLNQATEVTQINASHPFLLFHVLRALRFIPDKLGIENKTETDLPAIKQLIYNAIRRDIENLLAKYAMGSHTASDCVALGFCSAALALETDTLDEKYINSALAACFDAQDKGGSWPFGRVVGKNKDLPGATLEIPTYEVSWGLAKTVLHGLIHSRGGAATLDTDGAVRNLCLAFQYAKKSSIRLNSPETPQVGWCSDHLYNAPIIESWTSATVLQLSLAFHELAIEFNRRSILATFSTVDPRSENWPKWLQWSNFRANNEVSSDHPVLKYMEDNIIAPILADPRRLPNPEKKNVSAILFGPPGTSKTTIVRAVAHSLDWPLVLLSPGHFIEKGLEYIEVQANSVFDRLLSLSRVVVAFDECDELFRTRVPKPDIEQVRGIAAFVTASMLPKLQQLHDQGQIVFFICTNNFDSLDNAVRRGGRIDHVIGVGPPDRDARKRVIDGEIPTGEKSNYLADAIDELAQGTERFIRHELQRAAQMVLKKKSWPDAKAARKTAREVVNQMRDGLTINSHLFELHAKLEKEFSRPFIEKEKT